jgi:hypothetical protein
MSNAEFKMDVGLPEAQKTMWVYKTKRPSEEKGVEQTKSVGEVLGLKGRFSETPEKFVIEDGPRIMEHFKESGAIWYGDKSKTGMKLEAELPSKEEVKSTAETFLKRQDLLPEEAYFKEVDETTFTKLELRKGGKEEETSFVTTERHVHYGFKLEGIPVVGAGAKIKVTIGDKGEVLRVFKCWREVEKHQELPVLKPEEALEELQKSDAFADLKEDSKVTIKNAYLAYYTRSATEPQDYVFPVYVFKGTVETPYFSHEFTKYIPAVSPEEMKKAGIVEETLSEL